MPIVSQRSGQDERVALYPPELLRHFDDSFIVSFDYFEEYVERQFEGVDTSYYFVARDGDEVVAAIRCDASQPELGYVT